MRVDRQLRRILSRPAAGRIRADQMQATVARTGVGKYRIARGIIGLHEHSVVGYLWANVIRLTCMGGWGQSESSEYCTDRSGGCYDR